GSRMVASRSRRRRPADRREPGGPCWTPSLVLPEPVVKIRLLARLQRFAGSSIAAVGALGLALGVSAAACQKRADPRPDPADRGRQASRDRTAAPAGAPTAPPQSAEEL